MQIGYSDKVRGSIGVALSIFYFRSLTVMFEILKSHGDLMREDWWNDLFKIVYRIFDHAKQEDGRADVSSLFPPLPN